MKILPHEMPKKPLVEKSEKQSTTRINAEIAKDFRYLREVRNWSHKMIADSKGLKREQVCEYCIRHEIFRKIDIRPPTINREAVWWAYQQTGSANECVKMFEGGYHKIWRLIRNMQAMTEEQRASMFQYDMDYRRLYGIKDSCA